MPTATTKKPSKGALEKPRAAKAKPAAKKAVTKDGRTGNAAESSRAKAAPAKAATATNGKAKVAKAAKPATAKLPKVPIAIVRQLAEALERAEPASQVQDLADTIASLDARIPAGAKAVLAHTRKGAPVARAFLTALTDDDGACAAADVLVRHCATMERGRKAMRDAFVLVWRKAGDLAATAAAVKNFGRGLLDDPALIDAGIDAAMKLGDTASATSLAARLERAKRLAPIVSGLAGTAPARARAKKELAALGAPDRWHVYARVLDAPRSFDEDVAVDAIRTLADDGSVPDMALAAAILEVRYHGLSALVAHWKARVAAGDAQTILRMLGMFEWTALCATDDDQLEPYIQTLHPAGGRPEVFASIEHALAGTSMVVREAVLEQWLREAEGIRAFDDAQVDKLARMAVTIAEAGNDTADRRAATRALSYSPHPGARHALMDAIRNASTRKNDELRNNLYNGLEHIEHPDLVPFLADRLFVEREDYYAMLDALGAKLDHAAHLRVLGILVERAAEVDAIHAATAYADCIIHKKSSPRLLIDLGKVVMGWQPRSNDDTRRLRYLFEQATVATLALSRLGDARMFLARARELTAAGPPYSDYLVKDRDQKTPSVLAEPATKKRIAELESGELDREIADARAAAETARAAGTPINADDTRLGMLSGCTVSGRFFEDRDAQVVWFFDEVGTLHVYDGYGVAPPSFQATGHAGIPDNGMAAFIAGHPMIDERALLLDDKAARVREVIRLGDRLLVFDGNGRDYINLTAHGLRFATTAEARHTFARLVANPPAGTRPVDPWYVEGGGAVRRQYYTPLPGGGWNDHGDSRLALLGKKIDGSIENKVPPLDRVHASADAAITALEAWETRVLAAGGRATKLWIDKDVTRPEDTLLAAFLDQRYRDDKQGAAWHLRSLGEMYGAIAEANLAPLVPDVHVALGPPATDADLAAYQAIVPEPLPGALVDIWTQVGGGGFTSSRVSLRFLSPAEVTARRTELRALLQQWIGMHLKGAKQKAKLAFVDDLDVLALRDDQPLILFDTKQRNEDGRCFCSADSDGWESALGWQIATNINAELHRELTSRLGDVYRLRLGQRPGSSVRRARLEKRPDKIFEAIVDGTQLLVRSSGKTFAKPTIKTLASDAAAAKAFDAAVADARKKGFR